MFLLLAFSNLSALYSNTLIDGSSLPAAPDANCPCETNNYTCIPNCCCSTKCATFYSPDDKYCYPVPSSQLVVMCDSMSKDTVGSVSNWLIRTIFCVYRENNPLTKRGETFQNPDPEFEPTVELENSIISHVDDVKSDTAYIQRTSSSNANTDKSTKGYTFGQTIKDTNGNNLVLRVNNTNYPIDFGVKQDFSQSIFPFSNTTSINMSSNLIRQAPFNKDQITTFDMPLFEEGHPFVSFILSVFYQAFGYRQGPQYWVDHMAIKVEYSDYQEDNHSGFTSNGSYVVGRISFCELPTKQNLFSTPSIADEESWLPFYWKGIDA